MIVSRKLTDILDCLIGIDVLMFLTVVLLLMLCGGGLATSIFGLIDGHDIRAVSSIAISVVSVIALSLIQGSR